MDNPHSLSSYISFLRKMRDANFLFLLISEFLQGAAVEHIGLIIRHDVDRFPQRALDMALAEAELGIRATYYFRSRNYKANQSIIRKIYMIGHEVGYHYEVLADSCGDPQKARELFALSLKRLRGICPINTVAMHGRPFSPCIETHFWHHATLEEFGLIGDATLSFQGCGFPYLTDTGRSWNQSSTNIRDHIHTGVGVPALVTLDDVRSFLQDIHYPFYYLSFHPERWPQGRLAQLQSLLFDISANCIKRLVLKHDK